MKKQVKKLALAKETVRSLEALREVRGGSAYIPNTEGYWSCRVCQEAEITSPANGC
jgi:hypothetical protein